MPIFATLYQTSLARTKRIPFRRMGDSFLFEDALGRAQYLPCADFQTWEVSLSEP